MKIYHNSRCSKSRQSLAILNASQKKFEIIDYLNKPPSKREIIEILKLLNFNPIELVRKGEAIWKDNFKDKKLTDDAIIQAMINFPILIERPIVVNNGKAVIGRPPEIIQSIL